MKFSTFLLTALLLGYFQLMAKERQCYQIKIYHLKTAAQEARVDSFLQTAYLPALHRAGISTVGVFKPVAVDTADIRIYVLVPFRNMDQLLQLDRKLSADKAFRESGRSYLEAAWNDIPYNRLESILLQAFPDAPVMTMPALSAPKTERIYELRSYESPTEQYHVNKVQMFNDGDEIGIFRKLGFNAVFYGSVLSGSRMPNLMYMTTFNNKADRDAHWKSFSADPDWKKLQAMPVYAHNVSKSEITFLRPTDYSDI
ncbi:NIPSNAP family containing protein [Chitinophaga sp. G-6-1-13]|uniref:NIPSNAP family containing protein n=1 Tax=Chitinophaga fulva TaxID=2728842 RepID=A0A848GVS5_9BACT|nr:NIPSNAP family protein [Chitinophaga fulva]NML41292.1 NIPSNAP family containing protein [Chitinophaga fulva]